MKNLFMRRQKSFVLGAAVAIVGSAVGAGSVLSAVIAYNIGVGTGDLTPKEQLHNAPPPNSRQATERSFRRDTGLEQRVQDRRNMRLQNEQRAAQELEAAHGAAPEESAVHISYTEARRYCRAIGYTRSRLASCIEGILQAGEYNPLR